MLKTINFSSNYVGLQELFGLPAVGKTTFLKSNKNFININENKNKNPISRNIFKVKSFFYIIVFDFIFFKKSINFIYQSKLAYGSNLRMFLNLLRIRMECLKYKDIKSTNKDFISDQGFFQAVWSISVFSHLKYDRMNELLKHFVYTNKELLPKKVIILEDDLRIILDHELKRYGSLGSYYSTNEKIKRAQYYQKFILKLIRSYYILEE